MEFAKVSPLGVGWPRTCSQEEEEDRGGQVRGLTLSAKGREPVVKTVWPQEAAHWVCFCF